MRRRIGLLGCGTIGTDLAIAVDSGEIPNASLATMFDVSSQTALSLKSRLKTIPYQAQDFDSFISSEFDLMIEAASQRAVKDYVSRALMSGKDVMLMSVGAFGDVSLAAKLAELAIANSKRIFIPSGAVAGIDCIRAVRRHIDHISLTTTKNPKALAGAPFFQKQPIDLDKIDRATLVFEGSASEAVVEFPANVNVAAVLSLAGIGFERTKVRVVADPAAKRNIHEIEATGSFGEIRIKVSNVPSPTNPRTSYLAVLSAIECLRSICNEGTSIGS